jgi:hypothetical protein
MLGGEPAVPVHFREVEFKCAILLAELDVHVVGSCQDLVFKGAVGVFFADGVELVDDSADGGVLVREDGRDDVFVGEVVVAEVEVGWEWGVRWGVTG